MEIQPIRIDPIRIQIDPLSNAPPVVSGINAPVTVDIGLPIVNLPGCVEARDSTSTPLPTDDPKGNFQVCNYGVPSYNTIHFEHDKLN